MAEAERYQMGFDFVQRPSTVRYDLSPLAWPGADGPEGISRFTRVVREEVAVRTPNDAAYHLLKHVYTPFDAFDQEECWSLLLNTQNNITHETMIYRGTVNSVHIRLAEVFKEAVRFNAPSIVLSHVHPSGSVDPSPSDVRFTQEAVEAGKLLGNHPSRPPDNWTRLLGIAQGTTPRIWRIMTWQSRLSPTKPALSIPPAS